MGPWIRFITAVTLSLFSVSARAQSAETFTLIDTQRNASIGGYSPMKPGAAIDSMKLHISKLSVQAKIKGSPKTVVVEHNGQKVRRQTEVPYTVFGGMLGDFQLRKLRTGKNVITVQAISRRRTRQQQKRSKVANTFSFTLQSSSGTLDSTLRVVNFTLIDANSGIPLPEYDPIPDKSIINLQQLPTRKLNIRANIEGGAGSVEFAYQSDPLFRVDNSSPFSLFPYSQGSVVSSESIALAAYPFSKAKGRGAQGLPGYLNITFIDENVPEFTTVTPTSVPTFSPSPTSIATPTVVAPSVTPTESPTPTMTTTATVTVQPTMTPTQTVPSVPTVLGTPSLTPTSAPSPTITPSIRPTFTSTPTPLSSPLPSRTPTVRITSTVAPTPSPTPTSTPTIKAIPELQRWKDNMVRWGTIHCASMKDTSRTFDALLSDSYYDAQWVYFQVADYLSDTSWLSCARAAKAIYRDSYVLPNNGVLPGYWAFTFGLTQDYLRTGDEKSKQAAILIAKNAAFNRDTTEISSTVDATLQREVSYAIINYLNTEDLGESRRTRLSLLVDQAIGHMNQQFAGNTGAARSFMVGLGAHALIEYDERVGDSRILPVLINVFDKLWEWNWVPSAEAFRYDSNLVGTNDYNPTPDLNLLIAPAYAWLYYQTGETRFRDRGDAIFAGGVRRAYLAGSKQFNQNYRWSFEYVRLRGLSPLK